MKRNTILLLSTLVVGLCASVLHADELSRILREIAKQGSNHYQVHPQEYGNSGGGHYPYASPPPKATAQQKKQHAYETGFRVGQDDFHNHHSKHFTRHPDLYNDLTHESFAQGYEAGYDRARANAAKPDRPYNPPVVIQQHVESPHYPSGYYPYTPPPKNASKSERQRHAYGVGFRVGQDDLHKGLFRQVNRHSKLYDSATHDSFTKGYNEGFEQARSHRNQK